MSHSRVSNSCLLGALIPLLDRYCEAVKGTEGLPNPSVLTLSSWCVQQTFISSTPEQFSAFFDQATPHDNHGLIPAFKDTVPTGISHTALDVLLARYLVEFPDAQPSNTRVGQVILWVLIQA